MATMRCCSDCGAEIPRDAPSGLCAKCLLYLGLPQPAIADALAPVSPAPDQIAHPKSLPANVSAAAGSIDLPKIRYFGDYELLEEIARGGMGIVFKARQVSLNRIVALKMIAAGQLASRAQIERFHTEAEAAANLDHPNIVPIYEVGQHEGQHYFSMKFIEGGTLTEKLATGKFESEEAAKLMLTVAQAVHYAHQRGILHRDLKPGNILLDQHGRPHVADFGLAKLLEADADLTRTRAIFGTPAYMAPEQTLSAKMITTAADVYSLGAIFYELLAGRSPFREGPIIQLLREVAQVPPPAPRELNPQTPRDLETICLKCLEKEPLRRYSSAEALADDLARWLRGEPVLARRASPWERSVKWARRKPATAALAGMSFLATAALLGIGISIPAYQSADRARINLEAALQDLQRVDYVKNLALAEREWLMKDNDSAEALLDDCPPEFRGWEWSYLKRLAVAEPSHVSTNNQVVASMRKMHSLAFNRDGTRLICIGDQGVALLDPRSGHLTFTSSHTSRYYSRITLSPTGDRYAFAADHGTVLIHPAQLVPGEPVRLAIGSVYDLAFHSSGDLIATCQASGRPSTTAKVSLWNARTGELVEVLGESTNAFSAITFSSDGHLLAAAESNWRDSSSGRIPRPSRNLIRIWNVQTRQLVQTLDGHNYCIFKLAFSPDGNYLASGGGLYQSGAPSELKIWDLRGGKELFQLHGHQQCVFAVAFSPDGTRLASAGGVIHPTQPPDHIRIWDLTDRRLLLLLKGHTAAIFDLAFSPDGTYLVSASNDGTVRIWDGTPVPSDSTLDLSTQQNAALSDYGTGPLRYGLQRVNGVRFDVRGAIQLCARHTKGDFPEEVRDIRVGRICTKIHFLHASGSSVPSQGTKISTYIIRYENGQSTPVPVIYQQDALVRARWGPEPRLTHSWLGRVFITTWSNPMPANKIASIDFVSAMTECNPILIAVTVE